MSVKKRGIKVNILFFDDKINNYKLFETLYKNGGKIKKTTSMMHNKFCLIDEKIVINGSYNWTKKSKHNNENIQIIQSQELYSKFYSEFLKLSKNAEDISIHLGIQDIEKYNIFLQDVGTPLEYPTLYRIDLFSNPFKATFEIPFGLEYIYHLAKDEFNYLYEREEYYKFIYTKQNSKLNQYFLNIHKDYILFDI